MNKSKEGNLEVRKKDLLIMKAKDAAILVIDIQEKLIASIENKNNILYNTKNLCDVGVILNIPIFVSEQNPNKLGTTVDYLDKKTKEATYSKMNFSCGECDALMNDLEKRHIKTLVLCGVETHICVLQTALDLIIQGFNIFIVIDAIGSRKSLDHDIAIRRLERCGAMLATTESVIFEWCKTADRIEFKEISALIKNKNIKIKTL